MKFLNEDKVKGRSVGGRCTYTHVYMLPSNCIIPTINKMTRLLIKCWIALRQIVELQEYEDEKRKSPKKSSSFTTELQAIFSCHDRLTLLLPSPNSRPDHLRFLGLSLIHFSSLPPPPCYTHWCLPNDLWFPSHPHHIHLSPKASGMPSNKNVDRTAKKALLLPAVASLYLPTNSDHVLSINKFIHLSWASLWKD